MPKYQLFSDSSSDLPKAYREKYNIHIVPYSVSFGTSVYYKELVDLQVDAFFEKMSQEPAFPKTSLPSIQEYVDAFSPVLEQDTDIICVCLSSKFSGSFQSAFNAKQVLEEQYPERTIAIVDSKLATGGQGLLLYELAQMQLAGCPLEQVVATAESLRETAKINFTVDSLEHLQKGGRIGKAGALAGTILNIKPLITMEAGELHPVGKVRGFKKAVKAIIDMTEKEIGANKEQYRLGFIFAQKTEPLEELKQLFTNRTAYDILEFPFQVGVTIGSHAGPTALGLCYIKKWNG